MEYQLQRENPIAVFDSGVGGISVLRELIRIMPEEDFIYFGDSKNAPYGTKEKEKVRDQRTDPSAGVKSIGKTEEISRTKSIKKKKIPFIKY